MLSASVPQALNVQLEDCISEYMWGSLVFYRQWGVQPRDLALRPVEWCAHSFPWQNLAANRSEIQYNTIQYIHTTESPIFSIYAQSILPEFYSLPTMPQLIPHIFCQNPPPLPSVSFEHAPLNPGFCRVLRDSSRWNDAAIYIAIARTLNLSQQQRKTVMAARQYLHKKLTMCVPANL